MKLIEQNVEYIPQEENIEGIYKQIEKCARICYKSEDKTDYSSSKDFVDKLIKSGHTAMLEHGNVYLKIPFIANNSGKSFWSEKLPVSSILPNPNQIFNILDYNGIAASKLYHNKYSKLQLISTEKRCSRITNDIVIDESKHGFLTMSEPAGYKKDKNGIYYEHIAYVTTNFRVLIENEYQDYLKYICEPTKYHEKRYTLKLITSIGIVRELLRHRVFSFANESTRYCNYSKDKFDRELTYINTKLLKLLKNDFKDAVFSNLEYIQSMYNVIICQDGNSAQLTRDILPLCTKSELIMTGFASDWRHFFDLRLFGKTGKPHPDMVDLAEKAKKEFVKANVWKDIMRYSSKFE